ncbi:MAG TPA: carboxypeptidase regulatory-like domain-containing protein [Candidatus Sulfotelmatobacter sp.]|nr:carboxypeptidase regulatory-like domain-containing protein [Candidatus Sulfotelmatobacter sp.]
MSSHRRCAAVLSLAVLLCLPFAFLHAQSTYGSISGVINDSSGAAIPGAAVTLTNLSTSEKRTQSSGDDGHFTFVNLFPGQYRLDIEKSGFKHSAHPNVVVEVQQDTHVETTLAVGQVSETVEVTGETPLLQTESSSLGQVVEQRKADELPLNGRNIFNLITVSPAAVAQGGSGGSPVGQNPFSWGNYQVGGSFANQGAQYLDGQPLNIGYINLPIIIPTQDSIGEFKVQYNNLGAEWGKFSGGVVNLSTKTGTNAWHGSAYEYFRNKVLNANEYFNKQTELANGQSNTAPPWTQNQYGFQLGGPVIKDKTFFYVSWEQYRQRTGSPFTTTVPQSAMLTGDFSSLCTLPAAQGGAGGTFSGGLCSVAAGQLYDPYSVDVTSGARQAYPNNQIPSSEFSTATTALWAKYFPAPNLAGDVNNFLSAAPAGGNTNEFVARGDQNVSSNTRLFGRFAYFGLTDLPVNPFGTGLCLDRCAEKYHSKLLVFGINHSFTPKTILDVNFGVTRFVYGRQPLLSGFDLTSLGWPSTYNSPPDTMRTPPTPAFPFPNDVGRSQGNSAIGDHNTQYNISPAFTLIRGKHNIQAGGQFEYGLDNYFQTNIASGAFAFGGNWTTSTGGVNLVANPNFAFADFLLGLSENQGSFVNQTEGVAQVPAQTKGLQVYRGLYVDDTWHLTTKLTVNLGLRYELQGTWSDAYGRLSYWDPSATNSTVTGCAGAGTTCPGDAFLVKTGRNSSGNNIPMDKKAFSPRLGFAYGLDQKTVIRAGYGIFYIPNYVSFGLNPDNDVVNLASTPLHATNDSYITPAAMLDGDGCSYNFTGTSVFAARGSNSFGCAEPGPFGNSGIIAPPGRNYSNLPIPGVTNVSSFVAFNGNPTLAPYYGISGHGNPGYGYVEQWNFDIQRQLPAGFFADVAYAGSHGVHLEQYSTNVNQLPDTLWSQGAALVASVPNPMLGNPNPSLNTSTVEAGQLERPYPQYNGLSLGGYGCCGSTYNSLQATVTRRFQGGGTLLVAYTNAKLLSNTDTLTSWLEGPTGGVPGVQDWNNLKGERSLSAQDVSQRLVISYVLDLPFGHGKKFANGLSGFANGAVSGWGIDGITTFQRGFPLKISYSGSTPLEAANLGVANIRPDVVAGCDKKGPRTLSEWFNTTCFANPPDFGPGTESRVDSSLRGPGVNNFDFAVFKKTNVGERMGIEFRTEFFNLFNHPYFSMPATGFGAAGFGVINSTIQGGVASPERLIQFALKFVF